MAEQFLTTKELATLLRVEPTTIYQWRVRRYGPRARQIGRGLRFRVSDVEAWLAELWQVDQRRR